MRELRVTSIQTALHWENEQENLSMFEERFKGLAGKTDVIVLPEMFNSGFSMSPENIAQFDSGSTVAWMKEQAKSLGSAICGSLAMMELVEEEGVSKRSYYNRFLFVRPNGQVDEYDKRHCFRMSGENELYQAGSERVVIEYKGWRILPQICYDLRFPVFSRNRDDYDVIIVVANWPEPRRNPWRVLSQARAIENLSYVIAVNRIASDANGNNYSGDSLVVDYMGEILFDHESASSTHTQSLNLDMLEAFKHKFPAYLDADEFAIKC